MTGYRRIILTGGIGSGKSYVAERLASRGWHVIEADRVGHLVLEPGGGAFESVRRRWPSVITDGRIERKRLADIVFSDPVQLAELEKITHPAIRSSILDRVDAAERDVVVEIPLLRDWFAGWPVIVVTAPREIRMDRLRRRGLSDDEIVARMQNQPTEAQWLEAGDHIVVNDGHANLGEQLDALDRFLGGFFVTGGR